MFQFMMLRQSHFVIKRHNFMTISAKALSSIRMRSSLISYKRRASEATGNREVNISCTDIWRSHLLQNERITR